MGHDDAIQGDPACFDETFGFAARGNPVRRDRNLAIFSLPKRSFALYDLSVVAITRNRLDRARLGLSETDLTLHLHLLH